MAELDWFFENIGDVQTSESDKVSKELVSASSNGDIEKVKEICLKKDFGLNLNCKHNGFTALHSATKRKHLDVVEFLCSLPGIDINCLTSDSRSPFLIACSEGHIEIVQFFFELFERRSENSFPGQETQTGQNALHFAAFGGHIDILKILIKSGRYHINSKTQDGLTPLMLAVSANQIETVKFLCLFPDCTISAMTDSGQNCLHKASYLGQLELVQFFIQENKISADSTTSEQMNALHFVAMGGCTATFEYLLQCSKVNPLAETQAGQTILHKACAAGHVNIVCLILSTLKGKIDLNQHDKNGLTPLHLAASIGSHTIVQHLICQPELKIDAEDGEEDDAEDAAVKASKNGFKRLAAVLTRQVYIKTKLLNIQGELGNVKML